MLSVCPFLKLEDAHKDGVTIQCLCKVTPCVFLLFCFQTSVPFSICSEGLKESMERLQVDYIDIFQCHDIEFRNLEQVKQPLSTP